MKPITETRSFDRRRFVQLAGAGAGLVVAAPLVAAGSGRASNVVRIKVGVITSTGSSYGSMGQSLLDGLTLGFQQAKRGLRPISAEFETRTADRGYGGVLAAAQDLLDGGSTVVVGGISALVAGQLAPLFAERQRPLVVANVGAHVVQPAAANPWVLHNSLLYWQASYAAGRWAATHVGKRAFIAAALVDSGYDTVYAFRRGFESEGGKIVGHTVTHLQPGASGLTALFAEVRASGADVLYGLYSGRAAAEFVQGYAKSGVAAKLMAGSLGVEDYALARLGPTAAGALSCASWTRTRDTASARAFAGAFSSRFGRTPDPFASIGHDTATLVAHGARQALTNGDWAGNLISALGGATIAGSRGPMTVDGKSNTIVGPLWIRRVEKTARGLANVDIANAPAVESFPHTLAPLEAGTVAGYLNEYLCA